MTETLIEQLQTPTLYTPPIVQFELIETHLSWVLLAGEEVLKIKKPIRFDFVDFSTLEKRKHYCEQECKLNRRLAPELYLGVVGLYQNGNQVTFEPCGEPVEYAIKLRRFDNAHLLSALEQAGQLSQAMITDAAAQLAQFHQQADKVDPNSDYGTLQNIAGPMQDNFSACQNLINEPECLTLLTRLQQWCDAELERLSDVIVQRRAQGFVRLGHGDLHLNNMTWIDNQVVIFDCIEFNPNFYWIDTINDLAFLAMDLLARDHPQFTTCLVNEYCKRGGDYMGLQLLPLYLSYRAMVRAKVALLTDPALQFDTFVRYLKVAEAIIDQPTPRLIICHGLSGSGKSYLSQNLAQPLKALVLQSDRERKRHCQGEGDALYSDENTETTYQVLLANAKACLLGGYSAIIDATFIKHAYRKRFAELAANLQVPFHILHCHAAEELRIRRIAQRKQKDSSLSDATVSVMQRQAAIMEPLTPRETQRTLPIDTEHPADYSQLAKDILKLPD